MSQLNKLLFLLIIMGNNLSNAFLLSVLKDIFVGVEVLNELNQANRKALMTGVRNMMSGQNIPLYQEEIGTANEDVFTLKDMAGKLPIDVLEIIEFMTYPEKFRNMGVKTPKGVLMYGPPGTGKTSLARALANEMNAAFVHASGSDFIEIYVGVGPKRVRELFDQARQDIKYGPKKKAVIFIDELDAIGCRRSSDNGGGNSEYRNTLNELLNQMDGFKVDDSILVIGATNRVEDLDPALLRPGRFDRLVPVSLPDEESRLKIFIHYCHQINYDTSIDLTKYAEQTKGWSPAEIKNVVNEAAVKAVRDNSDKAYARHFDAALKDGMTRKRLIR